MNVRVLAVAIGSAMIAVAAVAFVLLRPTAAPEEPVPAAAAPVTPAPAREPATPASPPPAAPPARTPARAAAATPAPAPDVATLRIETDVPDARVFLDRQFVGRSPLTIENVRPGRQQLNVSADGFEGVARMLDVEPGTHDIRVNLREVRLSAAAEAVHRHRFGSCRGRLVADAKGLRYETSHEDAFTASFDDIQTFEVDYLENNLRLRLRGGRQYNFAGPDGSPDSLFAFHRDVENARTRLAAGDTLAGD